MKKGAVRSEIISLSCLVFQSKNNYLRLYKTGPHDLTEL